MAEVAGVDGGPGQRRLPGEVAVVGGLQPGLHQAEAEREAACSSRLSPGLPVSIDV